jgi:hypothetical protein
MTQNQWNKEEGVPLEHQEEWTIDKLKAQNTGGRGYAEETH